MVDALKLKTTYLPHLTKQFNSGSLVLFTGAGFSLEAVNIKGENLPSGKELTKIIYSLCFQNNEFEDDTELQDIFEYAQSSNTKELVQLLNELFTVNPSKCPDWYKTILSMPWLRAYTLNIDDLMEKIIDISSAARSPNQISAMTDKITKFTEQHLDIIHLNGTLGDLPNNVTFSRSQYAERIGNDPFYSQLNSDLLSRPVVFIGTNLDEGPLWEHLITRGKKGSIKANELRPRSYLVLPHLNKSKQVILAKHNIVWFDMNAEEFCNEIIIPLHETRVSGFKSLQERGLIEYLHNNKIHLLNELLQIDQNESGYLLGEEPTWSDLQHERVANRACFETLWESINKIRSTTGQDNFIILTGTAGSGKSSALMQTAMRLHAEGLIVGWLDASVRLPRKEFIKSLESFEEIDALLINDADIYGNQLSPHIRLALERVKNLLLIVEIRSAKVEKVINKYTLGDQIHFDEVTMPNLTDDDINSLIAVLDKENRLGVLKGLDAERRISAFKKEAGRQILVAMYQATSGKGFAERAIDEFSDLENESKLIYGLISTSSAYRFNITRDEALIAMGETNNETLNSIDALVRRKLINNIKGETQFLKSRHRVIADIIYNEIVKIGEFKPILKGLLMIGVAKVSANTDRNSRPSRMLRTFLNHNFMKRTLDAEQAKIIYNEFEDVLSWDSHYWLHRGALELETNELDRAENFLNQAISLRPDDLFILNERAYLLFKKALANPTGNYSSDYVEEATETLETIINRSTDQSAHAFHVLGVQGLKWTMVGISPPEKQKEFLKYLEENIKNAVKIHPQDMALVSLKAEIDKTILSIAVKNN